MKYRISIALIVTTCLLATAFSASAALPSAGTLIKASGPAVYWYSKDGKRYVFPNEKTYKTWYADFSGVRTVTDSELASVMIGGNVTSKPGTRLVKITTDPRTYAVDAHGTLRWVTSESVATNLYGANWNTKIDDIADAFFVNYKIGAQIDSSSQYSVSAALAGASDIDQDLTAAAPSCTADLWTCGGWNACSSGGSQTRVCTKTTECAGVNTPSPTTTQSCTPVSNQPSLSGANEDGLVIAGARNVILAKFTLTAQAEALQLTKVRFALVHAASAIDVPRMRLYDGNTLVSSDAIVGSDGKADFSGVDFTIPKNGSKVLTIAADFNTISRGAKSGDDLTVKMHVPSSDDGTYELRGTTSATVLHIGSGGDKTGFKKILRKTVPTIANVSLPTATLTNGDVVASRFSISAASVDQLSIKKLTFSVSKDSVLGITSPVLRVTNNGSNIASVATLSSGCAASAGSSCTISLVLNSEQEIAAGSSKSYDLRLTVSGVASGSRTLQTSLLGDAAYVTGQLSNGGSKIGGTSYDFIWSDESGIPHDDAVSGSSDWTDGMYLKVLPNDVQVLTK